jgi:uncharacterized repeat protein (TIGR03803 family)
MRKMLSSLAAVIFVLVLFASGSRAVAQQAKVLFNFPDSSGGGSGIWANLTFDVSGNLYGTAFYGGPRNMGTVFELMPETGGVWTEKSLHLFGVDANDGKHPRFGVFLDSSGNLYGTTNYGGAFGGDVNGGAAFELTPQSDGSWTEAVLHNFGSTSTDGIIPWGGLIPDADGNLYGTTTQGGSTTGGTVFELALKPGGGATEKILYSVTLGPVGNLIFDSSGNLYGVASEGGTYGRGAVYELSPTANGGWAEKLLHSFNGTDGFDPYAGVILDAAGNLYGATTNGGTGSCLNGCGVVYELVRQPGDIWKEKVLHNFNGTDGYEPFANLIRDAAGNLYGTTFYGGDLNCSCGVVFEVSPTANGGWSEKTVYAFHGTDGANPYASLIFDVAGNLYGTTFFGGSNGGGTAFEIIFAQK